MAAQYSWAKSLSAHKAFSRIVGCIAMSEYDHSGAEPYQIVECVVCDKGPNGSKHTCRVPIMNPKVTFCAEGEPFSPGWSPPKFPGQIMIGATPRPAGMAAEQEEAAKLPEGFPAELVPGLVSVQIACLADQIKRLWDLQQGDGDMRKFAIVNLQNPCFRGLYQRFLSKARGLLGGKTVPDDLLPLLFALSLLGQGARKEYAAYCERAQLDIMIRQKEKAPPVVQNESA